MKDELNLKPFWFLLWNTATIAIKVAIFAFVLGLGAALVWRGLHAGWRLAERVLT